MLYCGVSAQTFANSTEIINAQGLPEYVLNELRSISRAANERSIVISSKKRTVRKQVEVMLDYYILCTKGRYASQPELCGIEFAKQVYHKDCHGGFEAYDKSSLTAVNIEAMTIALSASLKKLSHARTCMNHVVIPGIKTRFIAIDIKPSSIKDKKRYYHAVKDNPKVARFYYPAIKGVQPSAVKDSAFHLEFERQEED